jgi:hypothetical protein
VGEFLHARHLWRTESGPRRLELFAHATDFCGSVATTNAKSLLALSLVQMLFAVEKQLGLYRQRIEELFGMAPEEFLDALTVEAQLLFDREEQLHQAEG